MSEHEELKKQGREAKHDYYDGYSIACIADELVGALEDAEKELAAANAVIAEVRSLRRTMAGSLREGYATALIESTIEQMDAALDGDKTAPVNAATEGN